MIYFRILLRFQFVDSQLCWRSMIFIQRMSSSRALSYLSTVPSCLLIMLLFFLTIYRDTLVANDLGWVESVSCAARPNMCPPPSASVFPPQLRRTQPRARILTPRARLSSLSSYSLLETVEASCTIPNPTRFTLHT